MEKNKFPNILAKIIYEFIQRLSGMVEAMRHFQVNQSMVLQNFHPTHLLLRFARVAFLLTLLKPNGIWQLEAGAIETKIFQKKTKGRKK